MKPTLKVVSFFTHILETLLSLEISHYITFKYLTLVDVLSQDKPGKIAPLYIGHLTPPIFILQVNKQLSISFMRIFQHGSRRNCHALLHQLKKYSIWETYMKAMFKAQMNDTHTLWTNINSTPRHGLKGKNHKQWCIRKRSYKWWWRRLLWCCYTYLRVVI